MLLLASLRDASTNNRYPGVFAVLDTPATLCHPFGMKYTAVDLPIAKLADDASVAVEVAAFARTRTTSLHPRSGEQLRPRNKGEPWRLTDKVSEFEFNWS